MCSIWSLIYALFAIWVPRKLLGRQIRGALAPKILGACGRGVVVEKGTILHPRLRVGDRVQIGPNCRFMIGGSVTLGDDVLLAPEVVFVDVNHRWDDLARPIKDQGSAPPEPIRVGAGAWIGIRAVVLPGVTIGTGAIVGACAVVTKSVPDLAIAVGNPARVVGNRNKGGRAPRDWDEKE